MFQGPDFANLCSKAQSNDLLWNIYSRPSMAVCWVMCSALPPVRMQTNIIRCRQSTFDWINKCTLICLIDPLSINIWIVTKFQMTFPGIVLSVGRNILSIMDLINFFLVSYINMNALIFPYPRQLWMLSSR